MEERPSTPVARLEVSKRAGPWFAARAGCRMIRAQGSWLREHGGSSAPTVDRARVLQGDSGAVLACTPCVRVRDRSRSPVQRLRLHRLGAGEASRKLQEAVASGQGPSEMCPGVPKAQHICFFFYALSAAPSALRMRRVGMCVELAASGSGSRSDSAGGGQQAAPAALLEPAPARQYHRGPRREGPLARTHHHARNTRPSRITARVCHKPAAGARCKPVSAA